MERETAFKEKFVFVTGSTPQIITETIYALARKFPPVFPHEIRIITTEVGKRKIEDTLATQGILDQLFREFDIPRIDLHEESFVLIRDDEGNAIDDIKSERENGLTGDIIVNFVRELTKDPSVRLHCCLAGGRKTMSFYLGAALQLFGRPWDKLYHVLVTPEFESLPDFFFKPKKNRVIEWRQPNGTVKELNTDDAEIILAELPFVRLREKLDLRGRSFNELVAEGQAEIDVASVQPEIVLNLRERTIRIGSRHVIDLVEGIATLFLHVGHDAVFEKNLDLK